MRRLFSSATRTKVLSLQSINQSVVAAEYAVRGELAIRAEQLRSQLLANKTPDKPHRQQLPFDSIISCNIGNPQQLGQPPISFFRQVAALVEYPALLDPSNQSTVRQLFPDDAIERARKIVESCGGNIGAYSHSQGIPAIRKNVAAFIEERDGFPADPEEIFLTAGASQGVQFILQCLIQTPNVGVMIPIPQYPLYTATLALCNGRPVPYYLDEESGWGLSLKELERSLAEARQQGTDVRALCVINPGNPTGNCLDERNMRDIIEFCASKRLVLLADEVYQTNIYLPDKKPFHSFKKVMKSMGLEEKLELISFHSISKGVVGECGRRGGYFECSGIDRQVMEQIYKLASISLCPTVQGQIMVDLMVRPPRKGEPSHRKYQQEYQQLYDSLQRRAKKLVDAFNRMPGVSCQPAEGAMYTFPTITLPQKAIEAARLNGKAADAFYCMELLNATGVCVVPGSGFGQRPGTFHFRATFLPPEELFDSFIERIDSFHRKFMQSYA